MTVQQENVDLTKTISDLQSKLEAKESKLETYFDKIEELQKEKNALKKANEKLNESILEMTKNMESIKKADAQHVTEHPQESFFSLPMDNKPMNGSNINSYIASISSEWTDIDEQTFNDLHSFFNDIKHRKITPNQSANYEQSQSCYDLSSWLFSEYSHLSKSEFKTKILRNRQKPLIYDECFNNSAIDKSHDYVNETLQRINQMDKIAVFMVKLMTILSEYGQHTFLFDSSALQWFRSCNIMCPHDHDFDVGIFRHNIDPDAIIRAINDERLKEFGELEYEFSDGRIWGDYMKDELNLDFFDIWSIDYTPIIASVSGVGPNNFWYFRPFSLQKVHVQIGDNDIGQIWAPYPIEAYVIDECGSTFVNEPWNVEIAPINRHMFEGWRLNPHFYWEEEERTKKKEQIFAFDFEWLRAYCYEDSLNNGDEEVNNDEENEDKGVEDTNEKSDDDDE